MGVVKTRDDGTTKVTCAAEPTTRTNPAAVAVTLGPAPAVTGAKETVMLLAVIAADGKPLPVIRTDCTFGSAAVGRVEAAKVTCADARPAAQNRETNRIAEITVATLLLAASAILRVILKIEFDMITEPHNSFMIHEWRVRILNCLGPQEILGDAEAAEFALVILLLPYPTNDVC